MNKWIELGQKQMVAPHKAKLRAAKTRAERKLEKERKEREQLFGMWTKWHKERKAELLAGPYSEAANELALFLERMTITDAPALIELTKRGPWCEADADTRFLVLELIAHSIIYLREREGLAPIDDPIPFSDDEPDAFMIIREMLRHEPRQGSV
jgi:hypothetical protein